MSFMQGIRGGVEMSYANWGSSVLWTSVVLYPCLKRISNFKSEFATLPI